MEADTSTLRKTGHFYFALTSLAGMKGGLASSLTLRGEDFYVLAEAGRGTPRP